MLSKAEKEQVIAGLTDEAEKLGATPNDEDRKVRRLVLQHGLGFNVWFCVCCELAERAAKRQGFKSEVDRAYTMAVKKLAEGKGM